MKTVNILLICGLMTSFTLVACQDRLIMADNSPFGETVVRLGDTEVADIDGTKIYLSDVERSAASSGLIELGSPLTPNQPIFQKTLDALIDQRLLALDALRRSLDQKDETRRRLSVSRERILGNVLVETHLQGNVNETTIRRMYEEQAEFSKRGNEVKIRHILMKTEAEIMTLAEKLAAGGDFDSLAREYSEDAGSRDKGGSLGYVTRDMINKKMAATAFSANLTGDNSVSKPFETQDGWHILDVQDRRRASIASFEDMRSEIVDFMTYNEIQNLLKSLRAQGDIKLLFGQAVIEDNTESNNVSQEDSASNE